MHEDARGAVRLGWLFFVAFVICYLVMNVVVVCSVCIDINVGMFCLLSELVVLWSSYLVGYVSYSWHYVKFMYCSHGCNYI